MDKAFLNLKKIIVIKKYWMHLHTSFFRFWQFYRNFWMDLLVLFNHVATFRQSYTRFTETWHEVRSSLLAAILTFDNFLGRISECASVSLKCVVFFKKKVCLKLFSASLVFSKIAVNLWKCVAYLWIIVFV